MSVSKFESRASLGRSAQIGDIYDVPTEQILHGVNIFKSSSLGDIVITIKKPSTESKFVLSSKTSEKCTSLNLNGSMRVSFLCGMITGSGAVNFIDDKVSTSEEVQCSFVLKCTTVDERININDDRLKKMIAENIGKEGTHFISGISYGAYASITMTYSKSKGEKQEKLEGVLNAAFNKIPLLKIEADVEALCKAIEKEFGNEITFKIHADILPSGGEAPRTLQEILEYIREFPRRFVESLEKGKQIELNLTPLSKIHEVFQTQQIIDRVLVDIGMKTIKRIEQLFDTINESSAMLQSLVKLVDNNGEYVTGKEKNEIRTYAKDYDIAVSKMREDLGELLKKVRSGEEGVIAIERILWRFDENSITSPAKVHEFVDSHKHLKEKLEFIKVFQKNNIQVITQATQLGDIKRLNNDKEIYLFFIAFCDDCRLPAYTDNYNYFFNLTKNPGNDVFAVVDADVLPEIAKNEFLPGGIRIAKYFNGKYLSQDCLEQQKTMDSQCLAICDKIVVYHEKNIKAVAINFPCPNSLGYNECGKQPRKWVCGKCRHQIEYNFDNKFYCECGYNSVSEFAFKCNDNMHGPVYVKFDKEDLKNIIKNIKPLREVNILVIGETGVGKSTWINAIPNYITYETMEEALNGDLIHLIPTEFELPEEVDGNFIPKTIRVGQSENENFEKGQSTTQRPKAYIFRHGQCLYRMIDSPGIGDSRGPEQDKKNMEYIIHFLSCFKKLHGICILMKPNESVLTPSFEFCFKELLVQFHRSAVENIVFCFTNSSVIGHTFTPLEVLLSEIEKKKNISIPRTVERMYAFDNMAYRYLCAVKQENYQFPSNEHESNKIAFNISKDVSKKMLKYFLTRKPHEIEESVSIYRARKIILYLAFPMARITTNVYNMLVELTDKNNQIDLYRNDEEELKKTLMITVTLKRWRLKQYDEYYCRMCATEKCYRGNDRLQFVEAEPTAMDKDPYIVIETKHTWKNENEKCPECGPDTKATFSQKWLYQQVWEEKEKDPIIAQRLEKKLQTKNGIEEEIRINKRELEEYETESDKILKASAQFAHFLRLNSITTYNDATEKYFKQLIQKEDKMGTEEKKASLEKLLQTYEKEKEMLSQALSDSSTLGMKSNSIIDVMKTLQELKDLKHSGKDINEAIESFEKSHSEKPAAEEVEVYLTKPQSLLKTITGCCTTVTKKIAKMIL